MAENKQVIRVVTKGAKKSERQLEGVSGGLNKMATSALKAAGAYFGARALLGAIRSSITLFAEQELAEKKLEAALGKTSQQLLNHASALQQVTMFGDETIIEAQALAAAKGFDLVAAADLVSKTLGSSTNALTRYGIQVTGAVGSTERLTSLTENIAAVFGGQAAAQAKTLAGTMQQLKNAFGDLQETMMSEFAEELITSSKNVKNWIDSINTSLKLNQINAFISSAAYEALADAAKIANLEAKKGLLETQILLEQNPGLLKQVWDAWQIGSDAVNNAIMTPMVGMNNIIGLTELWKSGTDALKESWENLPAAINAAELEKLNEDLDATNAEIEILQTGIDNTNDGLKDQGKDVVDLDAIWKNFIKTRKEAFELTQRQEIAEKRYTNKLISDLKLAGKEMKAFKVVWKAAAISKAVVDTYEGAGAAYKALAGIPIIGPALGIAAEVAAIAAGMARVKEIKKAQYGADFVTSGPQLMMVGEAGAEQVSVTPLEGPNTEGPQGRQLTINVTGNVMTDEFVETTLVDKLSEALRLGGDLGV